jgi:hypothetical protein
LADTPMVPQGINKPPEWFEYLHLKAATIRIVDSEMIGHARSAISGATHAAAQHFLAIRFARTNNLSEMVREELDEEVKGKHSVWQQHAISLLQHVPEAERKVLVPLRTQMAATWEYLYRLIESDPPRWSPSWDVGYTEVLDKINSLQVRNGVTGMLAAESLLDAEKTQERINKRSTDEHLKALGRLSQRRDLLGRPDYTLTDLERDEEQDRKEREARTIQARITRALNALKQKATFTSADEVNALSDPSVLIYEHGRLFALPKNVATDVLLYLGSKYTG